MRTQQSGTTEAPAQDTVQGYVLFDPPAELRRQRPHKTDFAGLKEAYVERVVDGDTLIVRIDGKRDRLRLLCIDAPESSSHPDERRRTPEGDIVSALVEKRLTHETVRLEFDLGLRDPYDRLLAYVWLDEDIMLNESLVYSGLVRVVKFAPNKAYYDYFRTLRQAAKKDEHGFFADRR